MRHVIIGNSAGGIAAIEAIRECDKKGEITVISDEPRISVRGKPHINYSRPLISYLLGEKVTLDKMPYRGEDFYKDNRIELILNRRATKLNLKKKEVVLAGDRKLPFDKLLIATGGMPVIPEIKGLNSGGVFTFTKLADARNIKDYIRINEVKEAVVVGGGLIGLKATEALMELKIKVVIVELADRVLSATFDRKASSIIENALGKKGCELIANNTIVEINPVPASRSGVKNKNERVEGVILRDGKKISASLVIVAVGVRPNIELVKNTPIKTNKGILVDAFLQTNIKDIYAAGDCCEAKDLLLEMKHPIAIWPAAVRQGKIAGFNMAGARKEYPGSFAMNSVELCGIPTISVGETYPEGKGYQVLECFDQKNSVYKKIVLKNNKVVGAIFVGDIERAGIYTGLIKDKVDAASFKEHLLKEDFGLISLPKEYRKHLVAGEVAVI
jgi:NAD(P)H-nitrite reductase large subunit